MLLSLILLAQLTSATPQLRFRENDQTLPLGAWRIVLDGDVWKIQVNTAANGLYGTTRNLVSFETAGKTTFGVSAGPCTGCAYEFNSSVAGIRLTQVTTTNRDLISGAGAEGVLLFNSTTKNGNFYNGTSWVPWGTVGGTGTLNQIPLWTPDGLSIGNSLLRQGTNIVEQENSTTPQVFRVFKSRQATYTTNGRVALVLGDLSAEGITGFGSVLATYGAGPLNYFFGSKEAAPVDRVWQVDATAGTLIPPPTGASIGSNFSTEASIYPRQIANVNLSGRVMWGSFNGQQLSYYSLGGAETGYGIQVGSLATSVVSGDYIGIKTEDSHDINAGAITNAAGGFFTLSAGRGTGTGQPGYVVLKGGAKGTASGTTQHVNVQRFFAGLTKNLSEGTVNSLFDVALTSGATASGSLEFGLDGSSATDLLSYAAGFRYAAYNNGGAITGVCGDSLNSSGQLTAGTVLVTCTMLAGTNKITFQLTPTITVMVPTMLRLTYSLHNFSQQAVTILP